MALSLSSTYGVKLNPSKLVVTRHGFKGERQVINVSQNPNSIATPSFQTLLIQFPTLEKDRVMVPGTVKLLYDAIQTIGTDMNAKLLLI